MTISQAFPKRRMATGALLLVLALAGCGAEAEPDADDSASASPSPTADASSAPPSPTEEASEAPSADPADYESCGDGECDVSFSGSVEFPLTGSDGEWTVAAAVGDDGVDVDLTDPNGMGGGGGLLYEPGCTLTIRADGGGGLSCAEAGAEPPAPEAGGIVVHLLELNGDTAVVSAALG
ncbi:hypothetical protein LO763_25850 [Glycomyces sp. A-F 0318]|uniref:hypothetical protein n=1 Tax=Glycomyces amatae TaxID=2881355 RepID=UPI001E57DB3F|nr:hypothetical protein [Glycomyces amatae]MCD0447046.1 hypothetical protein [Glycomyces amatae]